MSSNITSVIPPCFNEGHFKSFCEWTLKRNKQLRKRKPLSNITAYITFILFSDVISLGTYIRTKRVMVINLGNKS